MSQPLAAIFSHQNEIAARARAFTGDVNEAGLLVGKVISRAFRKFDHEEPEDVISAEMDRELDLLISRRKTG